mgnify:FL=1
MEGLCDPCAEHMADQANKEGYEEAQEDTENPATVVRRWASKQLIYGEFDKTVAAHFERLAGDLEAGDA